MKITKTKIKRVFSKMEAIASMEDAHNPYRGQIYFLDGAYYAVNSVMIVRFTITLPGGSHEPGKLYVLEDYDATGRWVEVSLGQNVRTDMENAWGSSDRIRKLMDMNEPDPKGPVHLTLATSADLFMRALEPFKILDAHVQFIRDPQMLHIETIDGQEDMGLYAVVMNWRG